MVDAATVDAAMGARRAQQRTNTAKARAQGGTPPATNEARDSWITHHEREKKNHVRDSWMIWWMWRWTKRMQSLDYLYRRIDRASFVFNFLYCL